MQRSTEIIVKVEESPRVSSGVADVDWALSGGIPAGSLVLIAGNAGSGKTTLAAHFLEDGIINNEDVLYISLSETEKELKSNLRQMGFHVDSPKFHFIQNFTVSKEAVGDNFDFLIDKAQKNKVKRLVIDSFSSIGQSIGNQFEVRQLLHNLFQRLIRDLNITTYIITEMSVGTKTLGYGVEEYIVDGIILLKAEDKGNGGQIERSIKIHKMRATTINTMDIPYIITSGGIVTFRRMDDISPNKSTDERLASGILGLDKMLHGGFFRSSMILVSGATGTGKTILSSQFVNRGLEENQRCLFISYEEVEADIIRNSKKLGLDELGKINSFANDNDHGSKFRFVQFDLKPGILFAQHLENVVNEIRSFKPERLVIDSTSALESCITPSQLKEYLKVIRVVSKELGTTTICTNLSSLLPGGVVTETSISSEFDSIVMLRHVEIESSMHRSIIVLKIRGSSHEKDIYEFEIQPGQGIIIKSRFRGVEQVLMGSAHRVMTLREFETREQEIVANEKEARQERRQKLRLQKERTYQEGNPKEAQKLQREYVRDEKAIASRERDDRAKRREAFRINTKKKE